MTVTPDRRFRVSEALYEDFHNGKSYYTLDGAQVHVPVDPTLRPERELLAWHTETVWRG